MPTLGDLLNKFSAAAGSDDNNDSDYSHAAGGGETKTASEGGTTVNSLADIYLSMTQLDKTASVVADVPQYDEPDLMKIAEQLAEAEASDLIADDYTEVPDMVKVAAEYDAAGRLMARGFYDEFMKLAMHTSSDNTDVDSPSAAKTAPLGDRGVPVMKTNFAGSKNHDEPMNTRGGRDVYKNSLRPKKSIHAGVTGDDPEAAAISLGGGSPAGFATVKDLMA